MRYFQTTSACLIRQIEPKPVMKEHQCLCASGHPSLNNCSYRHPVHSFVVWYTIDTCSSAIAWRQSGLDPMGNSQWSAADGVNSQHLHSHSQDRAINVHRAAIRHLSHCVLLLWCCGPRGSFQQNIFGCVCNLGFGCGHYCLCSSRAAGQCSKSAIG